MNKQIKLIFLFIVLANNAIWFVFYSFYCNTVGNEGITENVEIISKTFNDPGESIYDLKRKILLEGDKYSFRKLFILEHIDNMNPEYMLFWALIMANKYDFDEAYYEVFRAISNTCYKYSHYHKGAECKMSNAEVDYISLDHLDSLTREFALDYLIIAANQNNYQAKQALGQYYLIGKYLPANERKGRKLIREADSLYNLR